MQHRMMRGSRFTERQIPGVLKEHEAGRSAAALCRKHGIGDQTLYNWQARYRGLKPSEPSRRKGLEQGYRRLTKLLAEAVKDNAVLREPARRSGSSRRRGSGRWRA